MLVTFFYHFLYAATANVAQAWAKRKYKNLRFHEVQLKGWTRNGKVSLRRSKPVY